VDNRQRRLDDEHKLLLSVFPSIVRDRDWFLLPDDVRARRLGWTPEPFPVAFHAQPQHPGQVPYGIYVLGNAQVGGRAPNNFQAMANNRPPFPGQWGVLSWTADAPCVPWVPKTPIEAGANLLNYALTFEERFREGV
jgi:hypothetical protein